MRKIFSKLAVIAATITLSSLSFAKGVVAQNLENNQNQMKEIVEDFLNVPSDGALKDLADQQGENTKTGTVVALQPGDVGKQRTIESELMILETLSRKPGE
ncbi:hypothetical protein HH303_03835 [Rhodospirillaceae bacterium KN72]|uniref:Uncharacterized protein n=1 Tax=Pacificispira spongiicola TaxID=2729598 RepID=A0A7Y0DXT7_9PROT|nr:hypothetical protein [Pacificispira spongiicola]NMM43594.1 hypothetical protein [Pacificispira spongiicola]